VYLEADFGVSLQRFVSIADDWCNAGHIAVVDEFAPVRYCTFVIHIFSGSGGMVDTRDLKSLDL
jgi:hypothetical protein